MHNRPRPRPRSPGGPAAQILRLLLLCAVGWLCVPGAAHGQAWYNPSWTYRKPVTIDFTKVGATGAPHANFPVLISLTDANLAAHAQADADDILFTSSDGTTKLDHEIEKYTSAGGVLIAWVRVPSLSAASNTVLYVYYGNGSVGSQQNATGVWDANYRGVWHLKEDPSGAAPQIKESTSNANNGTSAGAMTAGDQVSAKIGGGLDFDGGDDVIDAGSAASLDNMAPFTFSAWVYPRTMGGQLDGRIAHKGSTTVRKQLQISSGGTNDLALLADRASGVADAEGANNTATLNQWQYVCGTYDPTDGPRVYRNGVEIGYSSRAIGSGSTNDDSAFNFYIGNRPTQDKGWDGILDEVRASSIVRSIGWMLTEYNNGNSPSTFYTLGSEQIVKTWDGGSGTSNWGDANNWNPDGVPISSDDVSLTGANTIDVNVAGVCNSITLNNASLLLTVKSGNSLTASGNLTVTTGTLNTEASFPTVTGTTTLTAGTVGYTAASGSQTLAVNNYASLVINGGGTKTLAGTITPSGNLSVNGGTFDLGSFTANRSSAGGTLTVANGATLKIGGTGALPSNYSTHSIGATSTVEYAGTTTTVAALNSAQNYGNLTISGTGVTTANSFGVAAALTVGGGGSLIASAGTVTMNNGSSIANSGTLTFRGLTIAASATVTTSSSFSVAAALTSGAGSVFAPGGGTITMTGTGWSVANSGTLTFSGLTIAGTPSTQPTASFSVTGALTVNGSTTLAPTNGTITMNNGSAITNSGTLQFLGLAIAASATVATSSSFDVMGSLTVGSGANFSPSAGTITMYGGSIANSGTLAFQNFTIAPSISVTSTGNFSVAGAFTVSSGGTFSPSAASVISGAGTLTGSGTVMVTRTAATADFSSQYTITNKTLTNLTVSYQAASAQTISALTYGGLAVNNTAGVTLAGNTTVNGVLNMIFGKINTGAFSLIISSTGSVSRTLGRVVGNFQKYIATGATSKTFEVGDATSYTPVDVAFASVTVAADLTVRSTAGDHPNIGSSTLNAAKSVNRYWSLTNSGITFTTYSATFTFVAGDVDAGASTSGFFAGKYNAGWTYPSVGTKTATTTQITDATSFSDFQLGEPGGAQISGTVFEDANYGGGAGRDSATAAGIGRSGARVELYSNSGVFVTSTTSQTAGAYAFSGLAAGNYTVRVVSDSVSSNRTGYTTSLKAVQTYRTNASSGTAVAVTDYVGGQNPAVADAAAGSAGATMNTTTGVFSVGPSGTAQSITNVTVGASNISDVDFGYCFDVIVNTKDSGQGSLRQFLTNANTLGGDASLAQSGLVVAKENAVFMISNGTAAAGLRAANNYFAGGVATISPTSSLPTISTPMVIDAQKQPGWTTVPQIELDGTAVAGADGLNIKGGDSVIRGLVINRFGGGSGIGVDTAGGITIQGCYIGTDATGGANAANAYGVFLSSGGNTLGGTTDTARNVISGNQYANVYISESSNNIVRGSYIGIDATGASLLGGNNGIVIEGAASSNSIGGTMPGEGNRIAGHASPGIRVMGATATGNAILGNHMYANFSIGIDLADDWVTANDGAKTAGQPNLLMDFPVFTEAILAGTSLSVAGYVGSAPGQAVFAYARVEVFDSDNDASSYGEGKTYLGFLTTDANGNFAGTLDVSGKGLLVGEMITGTATDAGNNTSEFGAQRVVAALSIVKRALLLDGTPIATGTVLPKGTVFKFLLYLSNSGALISDVSLRDVLDPAFGYQGGTVRWDNSRPACASGGCSGAEESAIFTAASAGAAGTDALDGDAVSQSGSTIYLGDQDVGNATLNIAAGKVFAVVFTVKMR